MKLWIRKISVILITIMTLGMYIPPTYLNTNAEENKEAVASKTGINQDGFTPVSEVIEEHKIDSLDNADGYEESINDDYINVLTEKAKEQTITKLGPKIVTQVEDDFINVILPTMEEVLEQILVESGEDSLPYYGITESPAKGFGEKIFNIYDYRTKKDIARFHVRRDNRPLEGYWFNFHYHLSVDGFEKHREIGEIYWNKNIPPKWMA